MKIFLIGHKSPDLDAASGPVEYAELLQKTRRYKDAQIVAAMCDGTNKETEFMFKKFGVEFPTKITAADISEEDKVILVDHNEEDQRMEGINSTQIIEIVDHHKINVSFTSPLRIDVRPHGSASSIIYENFVKEGIEPSKKIAGLILSSILSDTQGLKSSTTTGWDIKAAEDLAKFTGEDIDKLTFEIFKAKSDITGLSSEQLVEKDYKVFNFMGKKVFIGQIETVEPEKIFEMKDEILEAMKKIKVKEAVEHLFLVVTDIHKIDSHIIYVTEEEKKIAELAFSGVGGSNMINIGPKMSRKKDIAPEIEKVLS